MGRAGLVACMRWRRLLSGVVLARSLSALRHLDLLCLTPLFSYSRHVLHHARGRGIRA